MNRFKVFEESSTAEILQQQNPHQANPKSLIGASGTILNKYI